MTIAFRPNRERVLALVITAAAALTFAVPAASAAVPDHFTLQHL